MSENLYYNPEAFGLEVIGEIDWCDDYGFDYTVVWKRASDGRFVYGEDCGCSCPAPFEDVTIEDVVVLPARGALVAFSAHCAERSRAAHFASDIVALIERMHAAGAR